MQRSVIITMGMAFADIVSGLDDRDYDRWLTTLTEASARLDVLETAVTELRQLCESEVILHSEQVLAVLEKHGAVHVRPVGALM
jgi:hypothetical protein